MLHNVSLAFPLFARGPITKPLSRSSCSTFNSGRGCGGGGAGVVVSMFSVATTPAL